MEHNKFELEGPMSYSNWIAHINQHVAYSISEYPLFTDAYITGEINEGLGPYKLLNTLASGAPGTLKPSIVLRADFYLQYTNPKFDKTDTSYYHGGWYTDEIAALVSLSMGIRLKAGDQSRRFDRMTNDPLGRPQASRSRNEPVLIFTHSVYSSDVEQSFQ